MSSYAKITINHAALRDIRRKTAAKAAGTLTFSIFEAQETAVTVPVGTVCAMKNKPFVQFVTTQEGVIAVGDTAVTVAAQAVTAGAEGNAPAGTVTVMVNSPAEVLGVTNEAAFDGGFDAESDEALRRRILTSYRICQTGFSADSVREQLLQLEEVADCRVLFDTDTFRIYVRTKSNRITPALEEEIRRRLAVTEVTDYTVTVQSCNIKTFDLILSLHLRYADDTVEETVRERVRALCSTLRIGESLSLSRIAYALADIDSLRYCETASNEAAEDTIYCSDDEILQTDHIEVNLYE